jgi:hypothetical protein
MESVLECDQDNSNQDTILQNGPVENNSIILGLGPGDNFLSVKINVTTGACYHQGVQIKNCRPECFRPTEQICGLRDMTGIAEYICRLEIGPRGAIASVRISSGPACRPGSDSEKNIVQDGGGTGGTLKCDGIAGVWVLDNPGSSYRNGPATAGGLNLVLGIAEAVIQPYDSETVQTIVFGNVNIVNVSEFTSVFGKAFERVIFKSDVSRGYYVSAAAACVVVAVVLIVMSVHRIVRRNTIKNE